METMKRGSFAAGSAQLLLALLLQFAPSIHLLGPHEHGRAACGHRTTQIHFDASPRDEGDAPCPVCAQLLTRQLFVESAALQNELASITAPKSTTLLKGPEAPACLHPDDRGPPLPL